MRSISDLQVRFRQSGRKLTPQRQLIFELLNGDESHPTAESVYQRATLEMPMISLKTVYQTLNELAELGEIRTLVVGDGSTRFDPNVDLTHHHLVCVECFAIRDVQSSATVAISAPFVGDFVVDHAEVIFRGTCRTCQTLSAGPAISS